jgi:hypothetical protein
MSVRITEAPIRKPVTFSASPAISAGSLRKWQLNAEDAEIRRDTRREAAGWVSLFKRKLEEPGLYEAIRRAILFYKKNVLRWIPRLDHVGSSMGERPDSSTSSRRNQQIVARQRLFREKDDPNGD